ncbi:TetR/AcrR family transcriptional regulator [Enterococcus sp. LJL99]
MARGFSAEEKVLIKEQLQQEFIKELKVRTIQQVRIDDLVKKVGIAKGSFYLFYPSKELLFVDVAQRVQRELVAEVLNILTIHKELNKKEQLKIMVKQIFVLLTESFPWLTKLESVEYEKSIRKLPKEARQSLLRDDILDFERVLKKMELKVTIPLREFITMIQIIVLSNTMSSVYMDYDSTITKMISVIIDQFIEEK